MCSKYTEAFIIEKLDRIIFLLEQFANQSHTSFKYLYEPNPTATCTCGQITGTAICPVHGGL